MQAYYLESVEQLLQWVQTHPEYSRRHIAGLAQAVADAQGLKRKERAAFLALIASQVA